MVRINQTVCDRALSINGFIQGVVTKHFIQGIAAKQFHTGRCRHTVYSGLVATQLYTGRGRQRNKNRVKLATGGETKVVCLNIFIYTCNYTVYTCLNN